MSRRVLETLKEKSDFDRVFKQGKRKNGRYIAIAERKGQGAKRLGIIINNKYGGAVKRNRLKRMIREAYRAAWLEMDEGLEVVVMPQKAAGTASTAEIIEELRALTIGRR